MSCETTQKALVPTLKGTGISSMQAKVINYNTSALDGIATVGSKVSGAVIGTSLGLALSFVNPMAGIKYGTQKGNEFSHKMYLFYRYCLGLEMPKQPGQSVGAAS